MMGSNNGKSNEQPVRSVTVSKDFAVSRYEVTQAEWQALMENNPSRFQGDNKPVERVSWEDAQAFVEKLSRRTGHQYRLLSEAEWEYAARGGTDTEYSCGDGCADKVGWHKGNSDSETHPVGQKQANAYGLHDMHGNVWEWVHECWNSSYEGASTDSAATSLRDCTGLVIRGGSWFSKPENLRSAKRSRNAQDDRNDMIGFRVARAL